MSSDKKRKPIEITKSETESPQITLDWSKVLIELWMPGGVYTTSSYVRPLRPNGFEYEATDGGQAAFREPTWPKTIGNTVVDGSIVWTCRDYGSNAADSVATHGVTGDSGITLSSTTLDGHKTKFTVSGGSDKSVYEASAFVTLTETGERLEQKLVITISNDG